jgi:hypothetical protein
MAAQEDAAAGVPTLLAADPSNLPTAESVGSLEGIEVIEVSPVRLTTLAGGSDNSGIHPRGRATTARLFDLHRRVVTARVAGGGAARGYIRSDIRWPATRPYSQLCGLRLHSAGRPRSLAVSAVVQSIAGTDVLG